MAALEFLPIEEYDESPRSLRLVSIAPWPLRVGPTVASRRAARESVHRRRRRTLVGVAMVAGLALLSLPSAAFGGTTGAGLPTDLAGSSTLASGMSYVVQPGDTVGSIAKMMNPVDPAQARLRLVHELDSSVVVPGEHILIP